MKRAPVCALFVLAACGKHEPTSPPPARMLQRVAIEAVVRLEGQVPALDSSQSVTPELNDQVQGLLASMSSADEQTRRLAREDLIALGARAITSLTASLLNDDAPEVERATAADVLGAFDSRAAADVLLQRVELMRTRIDAHAWLRAQCAWRLGLGTQDWIVPRLLLHLRYETDYETVIWMTKTLAHFGNYAGLDGLFVIVRDERATQETRDHAAATAAELAADVQLGDANELFRAWTDGDPNGVLPNPELSLARQLEIWHIVRGFSEWQLRGVDDGRFALARENRRAASLMAQALLDENRYVRTHAAQVLERMGRRAREAGAELLAALDDLEIAPQVALSLGAIGYERAESALIEHLAPAHPLELRVACARALGVLARASSAAALDGFVDAKQPLDLRMAAACSRIHCSPADTPRATIELLLAHLTANDTDTAAPELALETWLAQRALALPEIAAPVLSAWRAVAPTDPRQRVAERARLLSAKLEVLSARR